MFKKLTIILIVFSLLFTLSGCVGFDKPEETTTESTTSVPTVKVTIPEGYTLLRISWLLEEKGLCDSDEFINLAQTFDQWIDFTQYPFLSDLKNQENLCFALEGYIFPLTYEIPETATAKEILLQLLDGTKYMFNEEFQKKVINSGYTLHEILTIASIIEKEAALSEQRPMISSVIHNRMDVGMKIQCDPTVKYCDNVIKVQYPEKYKYFTEYYSTYECNGLMAGPICNPGMESIEAAISPADTEYLYFIIGTVEPYEAKYSYTFKEHDAFWRANKSRLTGK